jgi:hypothetical protein
MIEAYAFLAAFTAQILAMSVLYPARLIRYVRVQATSFPAELFAQLYPGVDRNLATERFLTRYRAANTVIAVLGCLLLGWLFSHMRRPDWDEDPVVVLVGVYFMMQVLPLGFVAWVGVRGSKVLKRLLLEGKRTAVLQRRGLFDFVPPFIVLLAVLGYFLFVAFVIYVQREPLPGFALIGVLTLTYALQAFVVYTKLYGKKSNPLETHAGRIHMIDLTVKSCVYSCIVCVVFFSFTFTIDLLDLKSWMPFGLSVCLLTCTLLSFMGLTAPPRRPEADGFGSSPVS